MDASCSSSGVSKLNSALERQRIAHPLQPAVRHQPQPGDLLIQDFLSANPLVQQRQANANLHQMLDQQAPNWSMEFKNFDPNLQASDREFEQAFQKARMASDWSQEFKVIENNQDWNREFDDIQKSLKGVQLERSPEEWTEQFEQVINTPGVENEEKLMDEWTSQFDKAWAESTGGGNWQKDFENEDWNEDFSQFMAAPPEVLDLVLLDPVTGPLETYTFEAENPYLNHSNPREVLVQFEKEGNKPLSLMALVLEAIVQQDPYNSDAWMKLGIVQAENEKELPAIAALQRSVKENHSNAEALIVFVSLNSRILPFHTPMRAKMAMHWLR